MNQTPPLLTPSESRDAMINGIRRRLVGPQTNSPEHLHWPGYKVPIEVVDESFRPTSSYPYGPWTTPTGEEVLPQTPLFLYPIATLGPAMSASVVAEVRENGELLIQDAANDEVKQGTDPRLDMDDFRDTDEGDGDTDADDSDSHLVGAEQQSIGFSVRIPTEVHSLEILLEGGVYHELQVAAQSRPWWRRTDEAVSIKLSTAESSSQSVTLGTVQISIGVDVRPQSDGTTICTIWARNTGVATNVNEATQRTLFQTRLSATASNLLPYEPQRRTPDSVDFLYRDVALKSVGHGCDSIVEESDGHFTARTVFLPIVNLPGLTPDIRKENGDFYSVGMLDLADMNQVAVDAIDDIISQYQEWIAKRRNEILTLERQYRSAAITNIDNCQRFLEDIKRGWSLVSGDPIVRRSLCDASRAMNQQRHAYNAPLRPTRFLEDGTVEVEGTSPHIFSNDPAAQARWRPFQIAFILSSIDKIIGDNVERRGEADVIWMPTGGGKTEAYLGLSAFTILWEKASQVSAGASGVRNTKVFMRYTLRLLTVQQIIRAASLICALELLRQADPDTYGAEEIRIGAWLGSRVTPNKRKHAVSEFKRLVGLGEPLSFILRRCPWCGASMGETLAKSKLAIGYRIVTSGNNERVHIACPDIDCAFSYRTVTGSKNQILHRGIPFFEVDEDVYLARPDFVVGTIDKVARIGWVPDAQRLFGLSGGKRNAPPPSLFIQDELHLIAGPLGSIDGAFEAMLEHLCETQDGRAPVIVAATATTKNFETQVLNLYSRESRVVPPPGLTIEDSFFAKRDEESTGKTYVGVCSTSNFSSASKLQSLVLAILAHQAAALEDIPANPDPYWSNIVFFSSRRSLGLLTSAVETTFRSNLNLMHALSGIKTGSNNSEGSRYNTRMVGRVRELTATSSEDVSKVLAELGLNRTSDASIGLCFATSMVEVGLDVPRLGLMTVMGQPKSGSQYIQVTGRVGRSNSSPGLVVTVLNSRVARDRAHYEDFSHWHERLYASVESTSVTPYTSRALERSLASVVVCMTRILGVGSNPQETIKSYWASALSVLQRRANTGGQHALNALARVSHSLSLAVQKPEVATMKWTVEDDGASKPFVYQVGAVPSDRTKDPHWQMLNSMRSVDQDASVKAIITTGMGEATVSPNRDGGSEANDDLEEL